MPFDVERLDIDLLLKQWRWLCTEPVTLITRTGFGDLFLRTTEGQVLCLNVGKGTLVQVAKSELSFKQLLKHPVEREVWFSERQLEAFAERGLKPNDSQCIGFKVPVVFSESAMSLTTPTSPTCMNRCHFSETCIGKLLTFPMAQRSGSTSPPGQLGHSRCNIAIAPGAPIDPAVGLSGREDVRTDRSSGVA